MRSILRLTRFGYLTALAVVVLVLASARDSGAQQGTQGTFFVPVRTGGVVVFANSFTGIIGNNGGFGGNFGGNFGGGFGGNFGGGFQGGGGFGGFAAKGGFGGFSGGPGI